MERPMNDPKYDPEVPQEVRTLLIAADAAANSGRHDSSLELTKKAHRLTAEIAERKVPAENFMQTLGANVDNKRLSDAGFREFVRNSIRVVVFPRVPAKPSDTYVDRPAPGGKADPKGKAELIREVRRRSLDLHRTRYMGVLDEFSMASFSVVWLSDMPESRLRELLKEIVEPRR